MAKRNVYVQKQGGATLAQATRSANSGPTGGAISESPARKGDLRIARKEGLRTAQDHGRGQWQAASPHALASHGPRRFGDRRSLRRMKMPSPAAAIPRANGKITDLVKDEQKNGLLYKLAASSLTHA